jgi:hypothetical protein
MVVADLDLPGLKNFASQHSLENTVIGKGR